MYLINSCYYCTKWITLLGWRDPPPPSGMGTCCGRPGGGDYIIVFILPMVIQYTVSQVKFSIPARVLM